MKVLFRLLLILSLLGYLIFVLIRLNNYDSNLRCEGVNIVVLDSLKAEFITQQEVEKLLKARAVYPKGEKIKDLDFLKLKRILKTNAFIDTVKCYVTADRQLEIHVAQRLPLLRVFPEHGPSFYLDHQGKAMKTQGYAADLMVVTGSVDTAYARKVLYPIGRYMAQNDFWNRQIEQIVVLPDSSMCFLTRVGQQVVYVGKPDNLDLKLHHLKAFYEKVLPQVGWNKYAELDISVDNQVIGRKTRKHLVEFAQTN